MPKYKIFKRGKAQPVQRIHSVPGAMRKTVGLSHMRVSAESGLVSIVVVATITIILSLMTVAFTKIMDRNLREAIDTELSSQAHYAAESGLNDARQYIVDKINSGGDPSTGPTCLDLSPPPSPFVKSISGSYSGNASDNVVKYTCVLINATPKDLTYTIPAGKSVVFRMTPASAGQKIVSLFFSWQNNNLTGTPEPLVPGSTSNHPLPQESGPGGITADATGLLRTAIYPFNGNNEDNDSLATDSRSYFMYPNADLTPQQIGSVNYGNNGDFVDGQCNEANINNPPPLPSPQAGGRYCNTVIRNITPSSLIFVRLSAVYQNLNVSIQGADATGKVIALSGAQAVIDVTGEGNDVLKRIQARTPLTSNAEGLLPENALQSLDTLCKRFRLPKTGPGANDFGDAILDDRVSFNDDPVCVPEP